MKILFYDVKKAELDYLLEKMPNNIEPYFFTTNLNQATYTDEKYLDAQALSVFVSSELTEEVLLKFPKLKFIFLRCVGYSNIDLNYCKNNKISIFNAPNYGNSTVAEYVFAMLLNLTKKIPQAKESIIKGEIEQEKLCGIELCSKIFGLIGIGAIGKKVANIAQGFNMDVLVYDINKIGGYNFVELDELLKKSDFISINCPLNENTKNLIDRIAISKMKRNAIIVNAARGEIIDTEALYYALINKKIKGAALDVIECEEYLCHNWKKCCENPIVKSTCLKKFFFVQKMLQLPNVIITPHNAYNTKEAIQRILEITLSNIQSSFNLTYGTKNLVLI